MTALPYSEVLAANVRAARARLRISQAEVARRMTVAGYRWTRQTVSEVEANERRLLAEEMLALSVCLRTPVPFLMLSAPELDTHAKLPSGLVVQLTHTRTGPGGPYSDFWDANTDKPAPAPAGEVKEDELQPVVAAIVTSDRGVLAGRRNDGKPPWTFIAGEQEPGERIEDAAIREVKEETTLRVRTGDKIGERVHPKTGRTMIYLAAWLTHGTEIYVGDEDELAEVRWLSLAEADELLPGMFEPVRDYLARELGEG